MNERSKCHRSHWLQDLKSRGLVPEIVIFEEIEGEWPWQESERYYIAYARANGWPLVNGTNGGDGVSDLSPESRERIVKTWKGRKHKPETIEKLCIARRLRTTSYATRAKMSATQTGRIITWGPKLSAATRKLTDDQVAEIRIMREHGTKVHVIAAQYGVHRTTISKIKTGQYAPKSAEANAVSLFDVAS